MTETKTSIEKRIKNIQGIYDKLDTLFDYIPENYAKKIKGVILGDKELKELINSLDKYRAPRILLVGRTGFGKSSLINALMGSYVAEVSDVQSCTPRTIKYNYCSSSCAPLEILDTRGISESLPVDEAQSAEKQILEDVLEFDPDVALLVLSCTSRDGIDDDIGFMKKIRKTCYQKNAIELPVIITLNKADAVTPSRETLPYSTEKMSNINAIKENIQNICESTSFKVNTIIPVSSCIDWIDDKGKELKTADQLNILSREQRLALRISFDGRYQISELEQALENSISNSDANMGMKLVFHLNQILEKIAKELIMIFCGLSSIIVGVSLPVADYFVLLALESVLVSMIMALSGRDMSLDTAKEFILSLTGTAAVGLAFRQAARIAVKFIPVAGNLVSAGIAAVGMKAIGDASIEYFIKGFDLKEVRKKYQKQSQKEIFVEKSKNLLNKVLAPIKKNKHK